MNAKYLILALILLIIPAGVLAQSGTLAFVPGSISISQASVPFNSTIYIANVTNTSYIIANVSYPRLDLYAYNVFKNSTTINTVTASITNASATQSYLVINATNTTQLYTASSTLQSIVNIQWKYINTTSSNVDTISFDPTLSQWYGNTSTPQSGFNTFQFEVPQTINGAIPTGFTRQDLTMSNQYTLTVNFVDSQTNLPIPQVSILDSLDNTYNTTTGTFVGNYPYSTVLLYLSSTGYNSQSVSYVMSGNLVETVQMTKSIATSNTALNLLYPQQVQFQILDSYGNYLTNVSVTATMINSVANNTNWFSTLFAISSSATPVNSTVLYGTTDSQGTVAFPMIQSAEYQLTFVSSSWGVNSVKTVSPIQTSYMWILPDSMTSPVTQMGTVLNYKLSTYPPASSYPSTIYLEGNYSDSLSETTSINFYFTDYYGNPLYNLTINNPVGNVSAQYAVTNIAGSQYRWGFNASTQQFGYVEQDSGIMLQGNTINGTSSNLFNKSCTDWACDNAGYGY